MPVALGCIRETCVGGGGVSGLGRGLKDEGVCGWGLKDEGVCG